MFTTVVVSRDRTRNTGAIDTSRSVPRAAHGAAATTSATGIVDINKMRDTTRHRSDVVSADNTPSPAAHRMYNANTTNTLWYGDAW